MSGKVWLVYGRNWSGVPERVGIALTEGWAVQIAAMAGWVYPQTWVEERDAAAFLDELRAGRGLPAEPPAPPDSSPLNNQV